jgi:hypothetical protein
MLNTEAKGKENYDPPPAQLIIYDLLQTFDSTGPDSPLGNINILTVIVLYVLAAAQSI